MSCIPTELAVKAKTSTDLQDTLQKIQALPRNISQHIFDEYDVCKKLCRRFVQLVLLYKYGDEDTHMITQSQTIVYWNELMEIMWTLWKHPSITEYLCKKMSGFRAAYDTYYRHVQNPAKTTEEKIQLITETLTGIFSHMK